jgi:hypothetical protein
MLLVNVRPFGNFKPGETVEVPDGAGFDHAYFEEASDVDDGEDQDQEESE